jgi:hypothetical protein
MSFCLPGVFIFAGNRHVLVTYGKWFEGENMGLLLIGLVGKTYGLINEVCYCNVSSS